MPVRARPLQPLPRHVLDQILGLRGIVQLVTAVLHIKPDALGQAEQLGRLSIHAAPPGHRRYHLLAPAQSPAEPPCAVPSILAGAAGAPMGPGLKAGRDQALSRLVARRRIHHGQQPIETGLYAARPVPTVPAQQPASDCGPGRFRSPGCIAATPARRIARAITTPSGSGSDLSQCTVMFSWL